MALPASLSRSPPIPLLLPATSTHRLHASLKALPPPARFADNRLPTGNIRLRCTHAEGRWTTKTSKIGHPRIEGCEVANEMLDDWEAEGSNPDISFLAKLAIAFGIAVTITLGSVYLKWSSSGSSFSSPLCITSSSQSSATSVGFTFTFFGYKIQIPEFTPGWIYFWLLMAAGCGLFISEEALNIWVGITLARSLTLDGSWQSLTQSFSRRAPYIVSTVLWVYCKIAHLQL
ncbi:hypothetical protein KSP40_PGU011516 [Platanthera guangdongensis]|uniref:Uncharacterized protein n=1 Tax=Platanthera guangdongensis TaxID=2320717 RepID=A0ABR2M6S4_9ASPA